MLEDKRREMLEESQKQLSRKINLGLSLFDKLIRGTPHEVNTIKKFCAKLLEVETEHEKVTRELETLKSKTHRVLIVSAFPLSGKTTAAKNFENQLDRDSSKFNKEPEKRGSLNDFDSTHGKIIIKTPEGLYYDLDESFPYNYVNHIEKVIQSKQYDTIYISTHKSVRDLLKKREIPFVVISPYLSNKNEWMDRAIVRDDIWMYNLLDENWQQWVDSLYEDKDVVPILYLSHREFLSSDYIQKRLDSWREKYGVLV